MAELFIMAPLFPGKNAVDQLKQLCKILGTPEDLDWPDALRLFSRVQCSEMKEFPNYKKR